VVVICHSMLLYVLGYCYLYHRMRDILTDPQEILAMYASERQQEKGETVMLKEIVCQGHNLFIVVDTTW